MEFERENSFERGFLSCRKIETIAEKYSSLRKIIENYFSIELENK